MTEEHFLDFLNQFVEHVRCTHEKLSVKTFDFFIKKIIKLSFIKLTTRIPNGAVKSLQLILFEVILTNQFVLLFRQKTKIFVYQILTNYFFNFKLNLKHLIQIEKQIKTVELKTN